MKKIATLTICAVMALSAAALTSCGDSSDSSGAGTSKSASADRDVSKTADKLLNDIAYKDQLTELNEDKIEGVVGVSKDLFKSAKVYRGSGATAEEIDCFEAVDEDAAKQIESTLESYVEDLKARFKDYAPGEMDKLEKAVLVRDGKYVFLSISDDDAKAKEIIG
ncbi:MAG: DUF4358 domain-containing protein [Ruminococcus sp.]|nr:DUF4358 domain-containing protein [Ruminococcus sp.]MBQ7071425.1 DUF4358 domain-containing protein [Ruminococcus sp.]